MVNVILHARLPDMPERFFIFALISHTQIRNDMSNQSKIKKKQNAKKSQDSDEKTS